MNSDDWRRSPWQPWDSFDETGSFEQQTPSLGKRTLTMQLRQRTASAEAVVEPKADPAAAVPRVEQITLTESWMNVALRPDLPHTSVQFREAEGDESTVDGARPSLNITEMATAGVSGGYQELPHLETIQRSFGEHELGGIRAFVGGFGGAAAEAIGAEAYTAGDAVAFRRSPTLHTAAHEAAHVVQQRAGVQLPGGVGRAGDSYEQNADAVADRWSRNGRQPISCLRPRGRGVTRQA